VTSRKLYSVNEAAELIGIKPSTLRRWIKKGIVYPKTSGSAFRTRYKFTYKMIQHIKKHKNEGTNNWAF
jgi:excisionase family DNA binding protein